MRDKDIVMNQLINRLAELQEMRKEIDQEVEEIIFQMKCIISDEEDKIYVRKSVITGETH